MIDVRVGAVDLRQHLLLSIASGILASLSNICTIKFLKLRISYCRQGAVDA